MALFQGIVREPSRSILACPPDFKLQYMHQLISNAVLDESICKSVIAICLPDYAWIYMDRYPYRVPLRYGRIQLNSINPQSQSW